MKKNEEGQTVAYNEAATCWHIMTVTRGGTVSLLRNLDAPTARAAYQRLRPNEWPQKYVGLPEADDPDFKGGFSWSSMGRTCRDGDIEKVEILGPEGAELDPWRGVERRIVNMAPEVERQRRAIRERGGLSTPALREAVRLSMQNDARLREGPA